MKSKHYQIETIIWERVRTPMNKIIDACTINTWSKTNGQINDSISERIYLPTRRICKVHSKVIR